VFGFNPLSSAPLASQVRTSVEGNYGTYISTGQDASVYHNRSAILNAGAYFLTGQDSSIFKSKTIAASFGSYATVGQDALLLRTKVVLATYGTYTVLGQAAGVNRSKILLADYGTYITTGYSSTKLTNRTLLGNYGSYTITGKAARLFHSSIYPDPQYVLKGIVYGPGGIYTGTFDAVDKSLKLDLTTGALVKPLSNQIVFSI